jgi:hypothetical protein
MSHVGYEWPTSGRGTEGGARVSGGPMLTVGPQGGTYWKGNKGGKVALKMMAACPPKLCAHVPDYTASQRRIPQNNLHRHENLTHYETLGGGAEQTRTS